MNISSHQVSEVKYPWKQNHCFLLVQRQLIANILRQVKALLKSKWEFPSILIADPLCPASQGPVKSFKKVVFTFASSFLKLGNPNPYQACCKLEDFTSLISMQSYHSSVNDTLIIHFSIDCPTNRLSQWSGPLPPGHKTGSIVASSRMDRKWKMKQLQNNDKNNIKYQFMPNIQKLACPVFFFFFF